MRITRKRQLGNSHFFVALYRREMCENSGKEQKIK